MVQNQIWVSWNNKQVSRIVTASESKDFCVNYKKMLLDQENIKLEIQDLFQELFDLIDTTYFSTDFLEKEQRIKEKEQMLRLELENLNRQLND